MTGPQLYGRRDRPLSPARQALAAGYVALARSVARPFMDRCPRHADDLEAASLCALVVAASDFSPGSGGLECFATFVRYRCTFAVIDEYRRLRRRSRLPFAPAEVARIMLSNPPSDPSLPVVAADAFDRKLAILDPEQAACVRALYAEGLTHEQYAARAGITRDRVGVLHRAALARFRAAEPTYLDRLARICGKAAGIPCAAEGRPGAPRSREVAGSPSAEDR